MEYLWNPYDMDYCDFGMQGDNVTWRRELLCEYLGLGMCDGKQLLRQLNSYGFLPQDVEKGLQYANKIINSDIS